jgi:hypothetical protein
MDCGGDLQNVEKFITDLNARLNYNFVASDTFEKKEDTFEEINRDYNAPTIVEKTLEKKEEPYVPASIIDSIPLEKTKNQKTHLSSQIELERNPKDFGKFVQDFCEVGEDFMDSKTKLKDAYCIWSKTDDLTNKKDLEKYLKTNFRSGVGIFPGESCRKNVFRGIKTKPLKFTPSSKNLDYEKFVLAECKVDYDCRISFTDFYNYFIEWKRISDPTYTISLKIKQDLKTFLVSNFLPGRIIDKQDEKDTKKFSHGVFGIGHEKNNFGFREAFRNKNSIEVCDSKTGDVLKKFDSCILAAQFYGIPYWTIGRYIRNEEVFQEKIFKYC